MLWTRRQAHGLACILGWSLFATTGCGRELTLQQVEDLLHDQHSNQSSTSYFDCRDGEGDWEYICQVRHEPTPQSVRQGVRPSVQTVGVRIVGTYLGTPQFATSVLPDEGPTLSIEELADLRKEEAAKAAEKSKERLEYARPR